MRHCVGWRAAPPQCRGGCLVAAWPFGDAFNSEQPVGEPKKLAQPELQQSDTWCQLGHAVECGNNNGNGRTARATFAPMRDASMNKNRYHDDAAAHSDLRWYRHVSIAPTSSLILARLVTSKQERYPNPESHVDSDAEECSSKLCSLVACRHRRTCPGSF